MKKTYKAPETILLSVELPTLMATSAEQTTIPVYNDDSQDPGNALARPRTAWDDEDDDFE